MPPATRNVTARYQAPDGHPAAGYVRLTPTAVLQAPADDVIVWPTPVYATLDATGAISVDVIATGQPGIGPDGWAYTIEEHVGATGRAPWLAAIPTGTGPLDLADVAPLQSLPPLVEYVLAAAVGAPNGVASLDADGLVPAEQLPDGGNGGEGTPSSTVVPETAPGQAATPGTASTHSRGDHTHGTPPLPTPGAIGAATASHTHAGAYDPAGTAATAVAAHTAAPDPHGDRADAASKYLTVTAFGQQAVLLSGRNNPQITAPDTPHGFARVDLAYTATGTTPDAYAFYYGGANGTGGTRTGYHNEYGELRARPALSSTVAFRAQAHASGSAGDITQVTSSDNNTVYLGVSSSRVATTVPIVQQGAAVAVDHAYSPTDYGLAGWVGDPAYLAGSLATTLGIVHLLRIKLPKAVTLSSVVHRQSGGSISLTGGYAALYDTTGARLAVSANAATDWGSAGTKTTPFTTPYAAPAGFLYIALLFVGTTAPNLPRYGTGAFFNNANLPSTGLRFAQVGSGLASMPTSFDPNAAVDDATAAFWAGVA